MKIKLTVVILIVLILPIKAQIYTPANTIQGASWNNYVGIGTSTPSAQLNIEGGHGDSRFLIHANGNGNPAPYQADLTLWASEPGLTWSGVGIGNNIHNFKTASGGLTLLNTARGGSYIRLLDNAMSFNVVSSSGTDRQAFTINQDGRVTFIGDQNVNGNLYVGKDTEIAMISGPTNCGAIQIKSHSGLGGSQNRYLRLGWKDNNSFFNPALSINDDLNVGIGSTNPDSKLTVKGKIHAEEVKIDLAVPADYVFEKYYLGKSSLKPDYTLLTLSEVEKFTEENHHLPNVPSAKEIKENGLMVGEMSNVLLQKIEELTLYSIEQSKEIEKLKKENESFKKLEERLIRLEKEVEAKN